MGNEIAQLEFRWTRARGGYFAIAASPGAMPWEQYLESVNRPPDMRLPSTVVYQTFGEHAAVVFRCMLSTSAGGAWDRTALAARALIGPAELLTPDIALGCAALGMPGFLRPGIGQALEGEELPALAIGDVKDEAASWDLTAELDKAARRWADRDGVAQELLAATLDQPGMAVAVQLDCRQAHRRDIAALLWGLWRLGHPILRSERDWTFSTGEEPLGIRSPDGLPHLIVRDLGVGGARPSVPRPEIVISQGQPAAGRYPTQPLADKLVAAYARQSVPGLPRELASLAQADSIQDRLSVLGRRLGLPAGPVSPDDRGLSADTELPTSNGQGRRDGRLNQDEAPAGQGDDDHRAGLAGQPGEDAATASPPEAVSSDTLGLLLDGLAHGNPDAVRHLEYLASRPGRTDRRQRLTLLRQAAEHGWYVQQFDGQRPSDAETCVGHLLVLLAEPDLGRPEHYEEMCQELAALMSRPGTPGVALLALERIARKRADAGLWVLAARIAGWRWLADLGRSCPAEKPRESRPSPDVTRRPLWRRLFRSRGGRVRSARSPFTMARIWLGLFLAETVVLCLLLVFR
jgi:hypothetical protein